MLGGSGKTPVVAALARLLLAAGERPAILSRGYGRRRPADGVVVVSNGDQVIATVQQSGDEPHMLARALPGVPVLVSSDRYLAGRLAERRFGCTVHLLDDGFQHVQLGREVDLLVMSRGDLAARLLPLGTLREPLGAARVADGLLVAGGDEDLEVVTARLGGDAAFTAFTAFTILPRYLPLRSIAPWGGEPRDAGSAEAVGRRVVAVAGIARPERFFGAVRSQGWDIAREFVFRDHHWFTARDVDAVRRAAVDAGADAVITTEKDAVRLEAVMAQDIHQGAPVRALLWAFLPMEMTIEPADRFRSWLSDQLSVARSARARRHGGGGVEAA